MSDRWYPENWDTCAHDQNGDDPDIAPCVNCGLLIEYIPEDRRNDEHQAAHFVPAVFLVHEEEELESFA